jgi:hypothetical protein
MNYKQEKNLVKFYYSEEEKPIAIFDSKNNLLLIGVYELDIPEGREIFIPSEILESGYKFEKVGFYILGVLHFMEFEDFKKHSIQTTRLNGTRGIATTFNFFEKEDKEPAIPEWFAERYEISKCGEVFSLNYRLKKKKEKMKLLVCSSGYCYVPLHYGKSQAKNSWIARLVALSFIPNPFNLPQVNHIDGNKKNNSVTNLEWVTHSENMQHAIRTGLVKRISKRKPDLEAVKGEYKNRRVKCLK